jgi:hypothetical protein
MRPEGLGKLKENQLVDNRTCVLLACSISLQYRVSHDRAIAVYCVITERRCGDPGYKRNHYDNLSPGTILELRILRIRKERDF